MRQGVNGPVPQTQRQLIERVVVSEIAASLARFAEVEGGKTPKRTAEIQMAARPEPHSSMRGSTAYSAMPLSCLSGSMGTSRCAQWRRS